MRILIIDDNEDILELFKFFFEYEFRDVQDLSILTANSGKEGIEIFKNYLRSQKPIDIVLSDIRMPTITGIQVISQIRKIKKDQLAYLITAHDTSHVIDHINALGIKLLSKSIGISEIVKYVKKELLSTN